MIGVLYLSKRKSKSEKVSSLLKVLAQYVKNQNENPQIIIGETYLSKARV